MRQNDTDLILLDCTLRDGGYYTNWDFDRELVESYIEHFNQLPVDYLEIGYRSKPLKGYLGEYFYCPLYLMQRIREQSDKKLVIILNEKDIRAEDAKALLTPCIGLIDMIRLAVDPENFERALSLGKAVKALGFELSFNVMYMSNWNQHPALMENLHQLEGLADYLYMVDSYGGVYPNQVEKIIGDIRQRTSIPLGFHGHNNIELALINTLTAIKQGVSIVDATITGMGRGAGNLKTELLLTVLNTSENLEVNFNALGQVVGQFEELQNHYRWGTNLPYMVSGANSLPQKNVMEWVSKRFYSINSILQALENQKKDQADNDKFPLFSTEGEVAETVIIVGGGPSVKRHQTAIQEYLSKNQNVVIIHASSKNASVFNQHKGAQYFCLVGNEGYRLEKIFTQELSHFLGKCVLPPYPRKMGTYVPSQLYDRTYELPEITFTEKVKDAHTVLALQTAIELKAKNIRMIGYDGYQAERVTTVERSLVVENETLFRDFQNKQKTALQSLAPTEYEELAVTSIFAEI